MAFARCCTSICSCKHEAEYFNLTHIIVQTYFAIPHNSDRAAALEQLRQLLAILIFDW